jgi:hypothetical protein
VRKFIFVLTLLWCTEAQATKIHRVYELEDAFFASSDYKKQIVSFPDEAIFVAIDSGDGILVMKTDFAGDILWTQLYGDFLDQEPLLVESADGNLILAHYNLDDKAIVTKLDSDDGSIIWSQSYSHFDQVDALTRRGQHYVVMGAESTAPATHKPIAISVSGLNGNVLWSKRYDQGQAPYDTDYTLEINDATVRPDEVVYVAKHYPSSDPLLPRFAAMMFLDADTGIINVMHNYSLVVNANDHGLDPDAPFVWDIARLQTTAGVEDGFAISGTYSHSDTVQFTATDPVVFRVEPEGAPVWAQLYDSAISSKGFSRGILQNEFFFGDRLDVYTTWDQYDAIDAGGEKSGLMRIDASDGTAFGISIYDVPGEPGTDFEGRTMAADGLGGYIALATRATNPFDAFELIKVGQIGGGVECLEEHEIEAEALEIEREVVEILHENFVPIVDDYELAVTVIELIVNECALYDPVELACF